MNDIELSNIIQKKILHLVEVRPIIPEEKDTWNYLMGKYHYLGCKGLIGESLRYAAIFNDKWLALIGWGSAALCNEARDNWIGWTTQLKQQRLYLIANNVRFLILPNVHVKNLASKILSLNLKRLSNDWQNYHGHPLLMVETFVDPRRFLGICYKASNWYVLGKTKGFRKSAKKYIQHGQPKVVWCKPLCKKALNLLVSSYLPNKWSYTMTKIAFSNSQYNELRDCLRKLPEYRQFKGMKYTMGSIIAIAICAILSGARSYAAIYEWGQSCSQATLKKLRAYYHREKKRFTAPSERTIRRVLQECNAVAIDKSLTTWLQKMTMHSKDKGRKNSLQKNDLCCTDNDVIAIDGKVARGAKDAMGNQVHLLSAFLHDQGVVVAQREVDNKTNEIPELKPLLNSLGNIAGKVITADALHTQHETARFIVEDKKAGYVFTVKNNQRTLNADIKALNLECFPPRCRDNRKRSWSD